MTPTIIAQTRAAEKIDRFDPDHLRRWNARYRDARQGFVDNLIDVGSYTIRLQALGFRSDALRAEVTDAEGYKRIPVRFR